MFTWMEVVEFMGKVSAWPIGHRKGWGASPQMTDLGYLCRVRIWEEKGALRDSHFLVYTFGYILVSHNEYMLLL